MVDSMKKRAAAALLWFYTGWYAGAFVAHILGISESIGPIIGATAAALVAGDPRHIIWTARPVSKPADTTLSAPTGA